MPEGQRIDRKPQVALIGFGAIGSALHQGLGRDSLATISAVLLREGSSRPIPDQIRAVTRAEDLISQAPLAVVECAGHDALKTHGPEILRAGLPLIIVSVGALADDALRARLNAAAVAGHTRYVTVVGAIGGLDALVSARIAGLDSVQYVGRKPPLAWKGSPAETAFALDQIRAPQAIFEGTAREAALTYPKNANVTAAVALAGVGFDETQVRLIADPSAHGNMHEIIAEGPFGRMRFEITNRPSPDNPKTSWLAALSAEQAVRVLISDAGGKV